jgi:hypothetical protein
MSIRCGSEPSDRMHGVCGRPGYIIDTNDCNNDISSCNSRHGQDVSRWCASDSAGCCTRVSPPSANLAPCCLGQKDSFAECGADWCSFSDACKETVGVHCSDPRNVTSELCQAYCSTIDNKRFCDNAMQVYCNTPLGLTDKLCSCIHAGARGSELPGCFDPACTAFGYKDYDQSMQAQHCPDFCGTVLACSGRGDCDVHGDNIVTYCQERRTQMTQASLRKARGMATTRYTILAVILFLAVAAGFGVWQTYKRK